MPDGQVWGQEDVVHHWHQNVCSCKQLWTVGHVWLYSDVHDHVHDHVDVHTLNIFSWL